MKKLSILGLVLLLGAKLFAQINMNDTTVQVIGYWDKNEKQTYTITEQKYKVKDGDTTVGDFFKYVVDVSIIDSTADSYIIEWFYRDNEIKSDNEIVEKLATINKEVSVKIKTNELGVFQEVVNWKDVRSCVSKALKLVKKETKHIPNMGQYLKQVAATYDSKAGIEQGVINEIIQYYTYHGAKYEFSEEYEAALKSANLYGGEPFDTRVTVSLDEIDPENNNYILRMHAEVDSTQLTNATFDHLSKMAGTLKAPIPSRETFPTVRNNTWTASRIHGTGWVVYSVETKETTADGVTSVAERIIQLQ